MFRKIFCFLIFISVSTVQGQIIVNGDLEGTVTGFTDLPLNWTVVGAGEPHCVAGPAGTTPDLTSIALPDVSLGAAGIPFSGLTFVCGAHGVSANTGTVFHEGIKQQMNGLTVGQNYKISFRQTVAKISQNIDTSGSWMIILDTGVVSISAPSVSLLNFTDIALVWDLRECYFTATAPSQTLKFLPWDDDSDHLGSPINQGGSLYMGIDSISVDPYFSSGLEDKSVDSKFVVHPIPCNGHLSITVPQSFNGNVKLFDMRGRLLFPLLKPFSQMYDLSSIENGEYFLLFESDSERIYKKLIILK